MVQIYVPLDLHVQMKDFQVEHRLSNAALVTKAIEETHHDLVIPDQTPTVEPADGGLFSRSYRPRQAPVVKTVQFGVRLNRDDIGRIDHLVSASSATSRSAYIVAALQSFIARHIPRSTRDYNDPAPG